MMESSLPYISIVIAGRNDDYGGDFNLRLQNSINWYAYYFEKYKLPSEIIIVNYNPITENPDLTKQLSFSDNRKYLKIRIITAGLSVHEKYHDESIRKKLPFYEFPAKNIGIRRACGEYILSTNADVILHPSILKFIAKRKLKKEFFYRADRTDYRRFQINDVIPEKFINACKENSFLFSAKGFKYSMSNLSPFYIQHMRIKLFNKVRLQWELFKEKYQSQLSKFKIYHNPHNAEFKYHVTNSGDFMLMHRTHWHNLKGNPEKTFISTHADAQFVVMAGVYGLKEKIFFNPIFHQEHERRFGWSEIDTDVAFRKVYLTFQERSQNMINLQKAIIDNDHSWGFGDDNLPEETF